ncbi:hypothetical protein ACJQWK_11229 [Exserohilum turcicum]|uniref:Extradiol ring-cleavage dioxygenase class III enzyme subunit B domain-containing protein n=1 Tax=Exserohilum turcicum (strain 28A) TaxID=671987 RepID=R0KP14_EXST2|nr:uncharacterized protein SETTUDRAFT_158334 [Exserohilum turcica Et28A]EOA90814.1 hypothetical protein SETTUDRAFT_158334 [Exserohilum turcica Et28A]
MDLPKRSRAPSLFLCHGAGPFPLVTPEWEPFRKLLFTYSNKLDNAKGIVFLSAHWETNEPHITASDNPGIWYDYADVEPENEALHPAGSNEVQYPVTGDAELSKRVAIHLRSHGFDPVLDYKRGFDHGVYVVMKPMRPEADIPIVQISVLSGSDEQEAMERNLRLGRALEPLRDAGYAIIGSGGSYHDFKSIASAMMEGSPISPDAWDFEEFLNSVAVVADADEREKRIRGWREIPSSYIAQVKDEAEHFWPFLIASGAGGNNKGVRLGLMNGPGGPMSFFEW